MKTNGAVRRPSCYLGFALYGCWFLALSHPAAGATNTVTTVADSGAGTLRQAILNANAHSGLDTIVFNIPGTGPFTITPATALPRITGPVVIDGTTQPGYIGTPLIEINGSSLAVNTDGLLISAGHSTVRGLAINRCPRDAIRMESLGSNVIEANFLGTDPSGTLARPNGEGGVMINGSPGNLIGGTTASARNLISGGNQNGIYLFTSGATGNVVSGNYIGTTVTGLAGLGNVHNGLEIATASSNLIGGSVAGAGNVISGNGQSGIYFIAAPATSNLVQGNYIGVDANGTGVLGNGQDAVSINGVSGNTIGGAAGGAGNVLSGNLESGVFIFTAGATNNVIAGNYIGTDKTGTVAIPNHTNGVTLEGVAGNTVGGKEAGAQNVISGNQQYGVVMVSTGASNNMVLGNYIGADATGTNALANTYGGVIIDGVSGNMLGATNGRNVISGNTGNGVFLVNAGASNNIVAGNFIGTDATGEKAMANSFAGVYIQVSGNSIGGAASGAGNVISGNAQSGIFIYGAATSNNAVKGNFIGTDATGKSAVANGYSGVAISNAPANTLGGTASGAGNVISGNANSGISLGGNTSGTVIQGNYIGTDLTGNYPVANSGGGIYLYGSGTNLIGGAVPGAGNIISGNSLEGISVGDPGANGNTIQGNFIGTKADGVSPLGNQWHNIEFLNTASNNLVGGSTPAADNHLAYVTAFQYDGVRIRNGCLGNFISRNSIFSNAGWGIVIGAYEGLNTSNVVALSEVVSDGLTTVIQGSMNTYANGQFLIQFYENVAPNPSGYGEGLTYIASTNITTGANGQAAFFLTLPFGIAAGNYLSATATDSANTTWEFCADSPVLSTPAALQIITTSLPAATQNVFYTNALLAFGGQAPYTWSLAPGSASLPVGLTLAADGGLSGTLTNSGTNSFTVRVTDSAAATTNQLLALTVIAQHGSLQVTILPAGVDAAGAKWQVDAGAYQKSAATVTNVPAGTNTVSFKSVSGWNTPTNQIVTVTSEATTKAAGVYTRKEKPTLAITSPKSGQIVRTNVFTVTGTARDDEAVESVYFKLNGGSWTVATSSNSWTNWTATIYPIPGADTLSAYAVDTSSNISLTNKITFKFIPSAPLVVQTNGSGIVTPNDNGKLLALGTNYTLRAIPIGNNLFSNWVGGITLPYTVLSTNNPYTFPMQSNLVLEANFVPNPFIPEKGTFNGLFLDTNDVTEASSGFFTLVLTTSGAFTGKIRTSGSTYDLPTTKKFDVGGQAQFTLRTKQNILTFNLQLDINDPLSGQITGIVSNGTWTAGLTADRAVFSAVTNKAFITNYEGRYTLAIAGSDDAVTSPGGVGCATLSISSAGLITMTGDLADGMAISQSVSVSKDGRWPFYASYALPPAGNGGAVFSWITFSNLPASALGGTMYWFRPAGKTPAVYQSGFSNAAPVIGSAYHSTDKPLLALTNGQVTLYGGNLPFAIANQINLASNNTISLTTATENTNKLVLTIIKTTGAITGSFVNPSKPTQTITIKGVLLQNQTNAEGYFLGTNESGAFLFENP